MRLLPDRASLVSDARGRRASSVHGFTQGWHAWLGDPRTALAVVIDQSRRSRHRLHGLGRTRVYLLDEDDRAHRPVRYSWSPRASEWLIVRAAAEKLEGWVFLSTPGTPRSGTGAVRDRPRPAGGNGPCRRARARKADDRETAAEAGLTATFMARPLSELPGSGFTFTSGSPTASPTTTAG